MSEPPDPRNEELDRELGVEASHDPRDARIRELEAQLSEAGEEYTKLYAERDRARDEEIARLKADFHNANMTAIDVSIRHSQELSDVKAERDQLRAERDALAEAVEYASESLLHILEEPNRMDMHDADNAIEEYGIEAWEYARQAFDRLAQMRAQLPHAAERARLVDRVLDIVRARVANRLETDRDPLDDALAALDRHDQGGGGG